MILSKPTLKIIIGVITLIGIVATFLFPPVLQNQQYHQFADHRRLLGISNFWNVMSNLPFLVVGSMGLYKWQTLKLNLVTTVLYIYLIFFIGISLISVGSAYYHSRPGDNTLIWDRLPMTIAFMSLMSFTLAECLSVSWGRFSLVPLLSIGIFSVCYWYFGELHGSGDLRLYALVQFLPMILLVILLLFGQKTFNNQSGYWWLLVAYILAKLVEHFDEAIYRATSGFLGGHLLKHLFSAAGLYLLILHFERRTNQG